MYSELDLFLLEQAKGYLKSLSNEQFRKRFEVVHSDNLSAREPTKYFDSFTEREDY